MNSSFMLCGKKIHNFSVYFNCIADRSRRNSLYRTLPTMMENSYDHLATRDGVIRIIYWSTSSLLQCCGKLKN
jgi:hypothetical protein